jgi:hypothetical protein
MEATDRSPQAEVSRVAVRLPLFLAKRPAMWFVQAEAEFNLAGISSQKIKFCHATSQLDHQYATEVEDIITSLPDQHPYTILRTELMRRLSPSRQERIRQLLTLEEMAPLKLSQFLSSRLPPTYMQFSLAIPRAAWALQPLCELHL